MNIKTWDVILIVVILVGLSLIPSIFNLSIIHYVTGVLSVIATLIALAFFVMKTGTPIPEEMTDQEPDDDKGKSDWQKCFQAIKRSWMKLYNACNSVGFILFLCILLIISIGVFDSMMSRDNEVSNKCDCPHKIDVQKTTSYLSDSTSRAQSDTIR